MVVGGVNVCVSASSGGGGGLVWAREAIQMLVGVVRVGVGRVGSG